MQDYAGSTSSQGRKQPLKSGGEWGRIRQAEPPVAARYHGERELKNFGGPGAKPLVRGRGAKPPEADDIFKFTLTKCTQT